MAGFFSSNQASQKSQKQEFVGLSNQGATCYMNSLLQTLFMTPDFRNELYKWQYDRERHGESEDCIPMQLQILFGKLQLVELTYVENNCFRVSQQIQQKLEKLVPLANVHIFPFNN